MCIIEHIENHETIETSSYIAYFTATRQEVFSLQHMRKQKKKRASSVQAQASEANSTQEWHGKANAAHQRDDTNLSTRSRRHKF
jgi:hypothetical protein